MSTKAGLTEGENAPGKKKRTEEVTRIIALVIAFISVFIFFIKLLFL
jgi:hypothetical protein